MNLRMLYRVTCLLIALGLIGGVVFACMVQVQMVQIQQLFRAPVPMLARPDINVTNITGTSVSPTIAIAPSGNTSASLQWIGGLSNITSKNAAAARAYAEFIFVNDKDHPYKLTAMSNPYGFCSNVLVLARAYAVSVHIGRALVMKTSSMSYNCASRAGYQCFFNTSAVLLANNTAIRPSGYVCEQEWSQDETIRDFEGFPTFYSNHSSLCANVPYIQDRSYSGPNVTFPMSANVGFKGSLATMTQLSVCILWRLTDETARKVAEAKTRLALKRPYVGLHVRRGDKKEGARKPPVIEYLQRVSSFFQTVFLASDDEITLTEARNALGALNLTDVDIQVLPSFFGRNLTIAAATNLRTKSMEERFIETVNLITEIEILADAEVFVGTGTSNVGCTVAALRACRGHKAESAITMDRSWEQQIHHYRKKIKPPPPKSNSSAVSPQ